MRKNNSLDTTGGLQWANKIITSFNLHGMRPCNDREKTYQCIK